jgi:hypothetical protein
MMANIHIYKNNPTAGGTDGLLCSEGDGSSPVATPNIPNTGVESEPIILAIRCGSGFKTVADTTITPTGTSSDKWSLAPDNSGEPGTFEDWGGGITIDGEIGTTNIIFWAKAKTATGETATPDTTVKLVIDTYTIEV